MAVAFECVTLVAAPPATLFALSLDVEAHAASMRSARERVIGGVMTGRVGLGEEVTWRAWHFGVPWTMTSRITELDEPSRFVDEQVSGPFAQFRHEHRFEAVESGTRMTDSVTLRAPFGVLGRLVERALLGRYLEGLILRRNDFLRASAEGRGRLGGS